MIPFSVKNGEGAVYRFKKDYLHQLVGEGQLGEGEANVAFLFYLVGKTVGRADDKGYLAASVITFTDKFCQLL